MNLATLFRLSLALNRRGFPEGFSRHHLNPQLGTLSAGLHTNHTACGKQARVGSGRNMPGTPHSYPM